MSKQLVQSFFDDLNGFLAERDADHAVVLLARAFEVVAEHVAWWVPDDTKPPGSRLPFAGTKTKAQYRDQVVGAIVQGFRAPEDRLRFTVLDMVAEGDRVAAEVASDGLHASGKRYQNRYHFLFTVTDGRIVAVKEYMDTLHLQWLITPG
jgi:ketosteroid isomerase-like protein